tara:strand:- start:409 stop:3102 length:2694 start_codon:yes stop_codon:yes gene_type:complete
MAARGINDLDFGSGSTLPGQAGGQTVPSFDDTFGTGSKVSSPGDVSIDTGTSGVTSGSNFSTGFGSRKKDLPTGGLVEPLDGSFKDADKSLNEASIAAENIDSKTTSAPSAPIEESKAVVTTSAPTIFAQPETKPIEESKAEVKQSAPTIFAQPEVKPIQESKAEVKQSGTTAIFQNPLTGEFEEFDDLDKRAKREKQVNEQIVDEGRQREALDLANDFTESTAKFNLDLADPNTPDPVKTAQLNEMIAKFGPENQAAMDSMLVNLKQQGLDGQGAGNAMMLLMARGNRAQMSDMVGRLNTESAQRITDMNKWGAEFGLWMRSQINGEIQTEFQNQAGLFSLAVEAGDEVAMKEAAFNMGIPNLDTTKFQTLSDFETAQVISSFAHDLGIPSISGGLIKDATGLDIDTSGLTNPADKAAFEQRASFIESNISNPEAKKAAYAELAAQYPGAFGYGDDSEGAQAFVNGLDFSQSGAAATTQKEADAFWRTESIKDTPNMESVINAGDRFWESYDDGYIDNAFGNEINKISSLEDGAVVTAEILDAMSGFGVNSINDIDTREEKEAFMSLSKFKTIQGDVTGTTDQIFDNLMIETAKDPELNKFFTDEKLAGVTRRWILDNIVIGNNFEIDEKTGQAIITTDALPPWDERSEQFTFSTWPRATWDAEGNKTEIYSGQEFRDDLDVGSVHNDPAAIAEDKALTDAYLNDKKDHPDMGWLEWYDETQGNTKQLEKEFDPVDSAQQAVLDSIKSFNEGIELGDLSGMTNNQILMAIENDTTSVDRMIQSGKFVAHDKSTLGQSLRGSDWSALNLKADSANTEDDEGKLENEFGAGPGNGSVIIHEGRPMRIVSYLSDFSGGDFFSGRPDRRRGVIQGVYLDTDTGEKITINDSDWTKLGPLA